jgi:hypothetical protein
MKCGRSEARTPVGGLTQIELLGQPCHGEFAWIENVSDHGARVVSKRRWRLEDRLVIFARYPEFSSVMAKVVYCQPLLEGLFAVGCESGEASVAGLFAPRRA